mmetsp:Transcript_15915/g.22343  ORF Transcript_15915/g.22343 Transcript_15915/m.22343 type:complete len:165 (+) Transcript_15915:1659-2153(+)
MKEDYSIVICDFGLARTIDKSEDNKNYYRVQNQLSFPFLWTSPESLNTGRYDKKSDIYSLGVTLWEILSMGQTPHRELLEIYSNTKVMKMIVENDKKAILKVSDQKIGKNFANLVEQCLSHNPVDRPVISALQEKFEIFNRDYLDILYYDKFSPAETDDGKKIN